MSTLTDRIEKNMMICKEFPFVKQYLSFRNESEEVKISRFTPAVLKFRRSVFTDDNAMDNTNVVLFDRDGNEIAVVGLKERHQRAYAWWNPMTWFRYSRIKGETVEKAFDRLSEKEALKVHFIVVLDFTTLTRITIYKPPKGSTVLESVRSQNRAEALPAA